MEIHEAFLCLRGYKYLSVLLLFFPEFCRRYGKKGRNKSFGKPDE